MLSFADRKRLRESATETISADTCRSMIAARVDGKTVPAFWRDAALAVGITDTDSFLVHLGRNVTVAMQSVAESAQHARAQLRDARSALHAAIDVRCDELGASIDSAENEKAVSLERELIAIDSALERWRAETTAVCEAGIGLTDSSVVTMYTRLSSQLDDVEAALLALPTIVVTPLVVMLCQTVGFLPRIAGFGSVVMPLPVTATDLRLEDFTNSRGGRLGSTLHMRLFLGRRFNARSAEELEATLGILMGTLRIDVTFEARGCQPQPLVVTLTPSAALHCVIATVSVPMTLGSGFAVNVHAVSLAGSIVDGLSACVPVQGSGVITPLVLRSFSCFHPSTPCISLDGHVYCPPGNNPVQEVLVYDSDGTPQHGLATSDLGLLGMTCWTAHVHSDSPSLLLADYDGNVVAVDPAMRTIRWKSKSSNSCYGIAPLPFHGVVIVGGVTSLYALRLSDGSSVGCLAVPDLAWFLATDPTTGVVYGSVESNGMFYVQSWTCASDGVGITFTSGTLCPVTGARSRRPVAVMPPASGKQVSHLIVGDVDSSELLVLSLPDLILVHTLKIEVIVKDLATDPWGVALAVNTSSNLHVFSWPFPGMPPLC